MKILFFFSVEFFFFNVFSVNHTFPTNPKQCNTNLSLNFTNLHLLNAFVFFLYILGATGNHFTVTVSLIDFQSVPPPATKQDVSVHARIPKTWTTETSALPHFWPVRTMKSIPMLTKIGWMLMQVQKLLLIFFNPSTPKKILF